MCLKCASSVREGMHFPGFNHFQLIKWLASQISTDVVNVGIYTFHVMTQSIISPHVIWLLLGLTCKLEFVGIFTNSFLLRKVIMSMCPHILGRQSHNEELICLLWYICSCSKICYVPGPELFAKSVWILKDIWKTMTSLVYIRSIIYRTLYDQCHTYLYIGRTYI